MAAPINLLQLGALTMPIYLYSLHCSAVPKEEISLAPRRPSRPKLVPFCKSTAATYLRQTETQWLLPNLTRQEGSLAVPNYFRMHVVYSYSVLVVQTAELGLVTCAIEITASRCVFKYREHLREGY